MKAQLLDPIPSAVFGEEAVPKEQRNQKGKGLTLGAAPVLVVLGLRWWQGKVVEHLLESLGQKKKDLRSKTAKQACCHAL